MTARLASLAIIPAQMAATTRGDPVVLPEEATELVFLGIRQRAYRIEVENRRCHRTPAPICLIEFGGPEVFDNVQFQFTRQALHVTNTRNPRGTHVCEALNKFRYSRISGCF